MLELPESYAIAAQIDKAISGKTIENVIVEQSPHKFAFFSDFKQKYAEMLKNQRVLSSCRWGGLVGFYTEDYMVYFSDGASPRFYPAGELPQKHQMLISFQDGSALACSVQMYGGMQVWPKGECRHEYWLSSSSKPDALSDEFSFDYFYSLFAQNGRKMTVKAFLATEQRIPGLGNGCLQDILWQAGLDPRLDMRDVTEGDSKKLYEAVKTVLSAMVKGGGRDTEKDLFGAYGGYRTKLCKNTLDTPCPRCGEKIAKTAYMGGTVYFCPNCQKR